MSHKWICTNNKCLNNNSIFNCLNNNKIFIPRNCLAELVILIQDQATHIVQADQMINMHNTISSNNNITPIHSTRHQLTETSLKPIWKTKSKREMTWWHTLTTSQLLRFRKQMDTNLKILMIKTSEVLYQVTIPELNL
jgi:hypothetical protein